MKPRTYRFSAATRRPPDDGLRRLAVEQLCHSMPIGGAALDAHGRVLFCNREGIDLLSRWNTGRAVTKARLNATAVPPEIISACERLREGVRRPGTKAARPSFGGRILLRHPDEPGLTAVVALDRSPRDRRCAIFCVLFQDTLKDSVRAGRKEQLALLTLAERRVAKLVAEGLRNSEVAAALGKSVTTVKSQLGAIYSKLSVSSRTQLVAILRPSDAA
ncbi:hypothetical protein DB347_20360 [Opitutaceae bacterium EW11]|nr:hypothetical protein DB347_20360 [Opitutaceae bacterium EW11]